MNNTVTNIHTVGVCRQTSVVLSLLLGAATLGLSTLMSFAGATQSAVPFHSLVQELNPGFRDAGDCPEINWPLQLDGFSDSVTQDRVVKGGEHELTIVTRVEGIATDALGNTFHFSYNNLLKGNFVASVGEETSIFIVDSFKMQGETGNISFGFGGILHLDALGHFHSLDVDHAHGNYLCDPI